MTDRAKQAATVLRECVESIEAIFQASGFALAEGDHLADVRAALYGRMLANHPADYDALISIERS